jgi:IS5 family transposase
VPGPTTQTLAALTPTRTFISGQAEPGSRRTRKRLARYRTGCEGRISHLKRGYGLRRSRLKGHQGQRIWTGWAILAYNLEPSPSIPPDRAADRRQAHTGHPVQARLTLRLSGGSD